jgi:glutathione S-transferase
LDQVADQLKRMGTGFLFAEHPTAADFATAALLEPLVPAAAQLGYDREPAWAAVVQLIGRVRPAATTRSGGKRIREADWQEWATLNATAPPAAMPALRCECGVPDWSKA